MTRHLDWTQIPAGKVPDDAPRGVKEHADEGHEVFIANDLGVIVWKTQAANGGRRKFWRDDNGRPYTRLESLLWAIGVR